MFLWCALLCCVTCAKHCFGMSTRQLDRIRIINIIRVLPDGRLAHSGLHRAPQGSLGIPRKPYFYLFSEICWSIFGIFGQILKFLIKITWFLSFSSKSDAESLCHFVKIPFLDLKRAKLDQKSEIGHVRTCQDLFY